MANLTQNDPKKRMELGYIVVDYTKDDIKVFDNIQNLAASFPLKPLKNLIVLCNSGSVSFTLDDNQISMRQGDVLLCPSTNNITNFHFSSDFDCKTLCLSDHVIRGLLHDKIEVWHNTVYAKKISLIPLKDVTVEEFNCYYTLISSKTQNHKSVPYEIVNALIRALLLELCSILQETSGIDEDIKLSQGKILYNRFLGMISSNKVKRQPINHYASQLAITPKYLTMLCLKYSNKTASEWIIQYTTEDIRFYLRNSNLSIKEISALLGFANMSHFGSYVRKHLGMSPSTFRHRR